MRQPKQKRVLLLAGCAGVYILSGLGWLLWRYYPAIQSLMKPENMDAFKDVLHAFGPAGAALLVGLQILQVLSGVLPSLPIQLAAGLTYGAIGGLAVCFSGIFAGSTLVFLLVKRYGQPLVDKVFPKEKQAKLAFLNDSAQLNRIVFILYLVPALPKDVFTYLAALTPISFRSFMAISMTARIPMILCSTFASGALMEGRYTTAVLVFCITGAAGLLGMASGPKLLEKLRRKRRKA